MKWGSIRGWALIGCAAVALTQGAAWADGVKQKFSIPAQDLAAALTQFADQADREILFSPDATVSKRARTVKGEYAPEEALAKLLAGTGLTFRATGANTILVEKAQPRSAASVMQAEESPAAAPAADGQASSDASKPVEKVTVTGSRIRGAKQASPVVTITQDDMRRQGASDLGQVARNLPQSFAGGQNPGVTFGAGGISNQNISGSSSINLRGIGQDGTLTLLNGTRLPYDGFTQATDVASIPLAAVERMEILLDGASAIYGSDAVGGVANIILRRDYDGAEVSARLGAATEGGYDLQQYTGVAGKTWASGGFITTFDFNKNSGITASDRDYLAAMPPQTSIYAAAKQTGVLFSGHQLLDDAVGFAVDAFYTKREGQELANFSAFFGYDIPVSRDVTIWGVVPSLRVELPGDWSVKLTGAYGKNEASIVQTGIVPGGMVVFADDTCNCNTAKSASIETEGPLFDLPGGEARLAFGGGYRGNEFHTINNTTGVKGTGGKDSSRYVYGELYLPLVGEEQGLALMHRLAVSGAVRYEDYDSFGETTTPKVGAIWSVTPDLDLKATWGKSFKVPTLLQQHQAIRLGLFDAGQLGGTSGIGVLFLQGGNPSLTPEKAETLAAGFAVHPDFLPGFKAEVSWFDIDYADRIVQPWSSISTSLIDPTKFAFVTFNPTVAQQNAAFALAGQPIGTFIPPPAVPYDPATVAAIVDSRYVNSAAQHLKGVDLTATYTFDLFGGNFTANGNATWLETTQQITSASPELTISGFVYYPAEFRWRAGGTWSSDGLTLSANVNQTAGVTNNLAPGNPKGDAFTTVDLVADYVIPSGPLGGELQFTVTMLNAFNEEPPFMQPIAPFIANYDSTNYSALGRVVNVTVTQRF